MISIPGASELFKTGSRCLTRWPVYKQNSQRLAHARNPEAMSSPPEGTPWPGASTLGSRPARSWTDSPAASLFHVEYQGGPETLRLFCRNAHNENLQIEFRSTVNSASPVISILSAGRKKATWPGV